MLLARLATRIIIALSLLAVTAGAAQKKAGVTMPDQVEAEGRTLTLNGLGVREATALRVQVYVAGLYLETPSSDPAEVIESEQIKRMHLVFVRDVSRDDIADAMREGIAANAGPRAAALEPQLAQLLTWLEPMKSGQSLIFTYVPQRGVLVHIDGASRGVIEGPEFARVLFSIWLGPEPPNQGLKRGLLGQD
jgi:hypothetical protein